ncbi:PadR family transcriptional regulator [Candidatus Mycobacterium wuenschmannii]|uniref:PadR family transcriptional regulator n=1 Tax=Candidatus Mycobacterium wuenschmannii TaxID=3027808 RepID=A0ABY8VSG8_9MYCO|nr:PadR family transcriptional regulator [Candidatus Mycobacterium wuenschmannii]WIM86447.1 PadR family transcriptional regulator [Candidatus Mycobacterium wuenschmannii]
MNNPFFDAGGPAAGGPFAGRGAGFGFAPPDRRALHEQRKQARRDFRDALRGHDAGQDGPFGPGFGRGFGRGFGPGGFGPGFGGGFGGGPRGGRRGGHGRRGRRGDVRAAILVLLAERPMHGYEIIQEVAERSQDLWKPSPGSVYPTLQLLVDEGLIVSTESEGSKKLFALTDAGKEAAEKVATPPWEEIADGIDPAHLNLRAAVGQLFGAVAQSAHAANEEQQKRILDIVNNARREIYTILGEDN